MTDRFVALPVGQGDAFFLQRGQFTVLVDGGRSTNQFPRMFQDMLNRRSVEVLVCTHNDADHAKGVLGFLESRLRCNEVWLPGLWGDRLDDLVARPDKFVEQLMDELHAGEAVEQAHSEGTIRLDRLGDWYASNDESYKTDDEHTVSDTLETLVIEHDDAGNDEPSWQESSRRLTFPLSRTLWRVLGNGRYHLLLQALSAAERIRAIAIACAHRGTPVRWFRYSSRTAMGGESGRLIPLNAIEVARSRRPVGALEYLALSASNRRSLVLCSPSTAECPGVIFTADSDLRFDPQIPWSAGAIVTAPITGPKRMRPHIRASTATRAAALTRAGFEATEASRTVREYLICNNRFDSAPFAEVLLAVKIASASRLTMAAGKRRAASARARDEG